ncbi:MAG: YbjN domain-containing protein [Nitriliruptoraceae bacterium]
MERDAARALLTDWLDAAGVEVTDVGDERYLAVLRGEWKRTIPVLLSLEDRYLTVRSLFSAGPDEGHAEVYELLLQRNQRSGPVHFALDDEGDVVLLGGVALAALDERALDELLGALVTVADETFNRFLRTGFATYLEVEQRWREKAGLPPNPVGEPIRTQPDAGGATT